MADFYLDGSETSWLVYADWLEDQGLDARHIREPLFVNDWFFEFHDPWNVGVNGVNIGSVGWGSDGTFGSVVGVGEVVYPHSGTNIRQVGFNGTYPCLQINYV